MTRKDKLKKKMDGSDISEIFLVQIPQCVTALRRARRTNYNSVWHKSNPGKEQKFDFKISSLLLSRPVQLFAILLLKLPMIYIYLKNNKIIVIIKVIIEKSRGGRFHGTGIEIWAGFGPNGQLSCLHSFKIFWPMKPSYTSN